MDPWSLNPSPLYQKPPGSLSVKNHLGGNWRAGLVNKAIPAHDMGGPHRMEYGRRLKRVHAETTVWTALNE